MYAQCAEESSGGSRDGGGGSASKCHGSVQLGHAGVGSLPTMEAMVVPPQALGVLEEAAAD